MINDWQCVNKQFSVGWLSCTVDGLARVIKTFTATITRLVRING